MVPLLSQCILLFLKLLLNWGRGQMWHDSNLNIISAQFLTTLGPYINSPPSSQLTWVSLQTCGFPIFILFEVLFPASTGLLAPFSASSEHSIGAIGLRDGFIPVLGGEHIFVVFWHNPHIVFLLFRLNMNCPNPLNTAQASRFWCFYWQWWAITSSTQHILQYFYKCLVWYGL